MQRRGGAANLEPPSRQGVTVQRFFTKHARPDVAAVLLGAALLALPALAKEAAKPAARPPIVDPRADQVLRAMGDYLAEGREFSVRADILFDDVLPTGQKLQRGAHEDVAVRRPNRLYVEYAGDLGASQLWYDGKQLTMYDLHDNVYAATPMPGKIDAALDRLIETHGFTPPLSDLVRSDPYRRLRERVQFGIYVGLTDVGGTRCHHLAFVDKEIDWQIWVEDGTQFVPRKVVITYLSQPGSPQFQAVFSHWKFHQRLADALFVPALPGDAMKVDFVPSPLTGGKK